MFPQNGCKLFLIYLFFVGLLINLMVIAPVEVIGQNGWDTDREELSFELVILVIGDPAYDVPTTEGGKLIKNNLEAIGFNITLRPTIPEECYYISYPNESVTIRHYDLMYYSSPLRHYEPRILFYNFHSQMDFAGGGNFVCIHNDTLDTHLDFMMNSTMEEVPHHLYKGQEILAEEVPYVHILLTEDNYPIRHGMAGIIHTKGGFISPYNLLTNLNIHNTTTLP
ncbi:MAG: hypothetical protein ACFFCQ_08695, partial [Promethearchaeota archaeon]